MMEAKETVMSSEERTKVLIDIGSDNCDEVIDEAICQKQAEISFKAGIKEVVDWVDSFIPSQYRKEELWQAKVKGWLGEDK
jgi:hypothetical protein